LGCLVIRERGLYGNKLQSGGACRQRIIYIIRHRPQWERAYVERMPLYRRLHSNATIHSRCQRRRSPLSRGSQTPRMPFHLASCRGSASRKATIIINTRAGRSQPAALPQRAVVLPRLRGWTANASISVLLGKKMRHDFLRPEIRSAGRPAWVTCRSKYAGPFGAVHVPLARAPPRLIRLSKRLIVCMYVQI